MEAICWEKNTKKTATEADERIKELVDTRTALLNILEDMEESRAKLEQAYWELAAMERVSGFAYMVFKRALEPLLRKCRRKTVAMVRNQIKRAAKTTGLAKAIKIASNGRISIDEPSLRENIVGLSPDKGMGAVGSIFSTIMDSCYPSIRTDMGGEDADEILASAFSSMLEKRDGAYKPALLKIIPNTIKVPIQYRLLEPGHSYLVEEPEPKHAFGMFGELARLGFPSLGITRMHPNNVKVEYGLKGISMLWLAKAEVDEGISPSSLGILRDTIEAFMKMHEESVVLLDGLEYLISINGFDLTLKFLHDVFESVVLRGARLIVSLNPATVDKKQLALLERHMEPIEVIVE